MTYSAFPTASSCTAEQPAPKNPATFESLTEVTMLGYTKVHLHGPEAPWLLADIPGFSCLANKAAGLVAPPCFKLDPNESTMHWRPVIWVLYGLLV